MSCEKCKDNHPFFPTATDSGITISANTTPFDTNSTVFFTTATDSSGTTTNYINGFPIDCACECHDLCDGKDCDCGDGHD
jgi:hypothetical protein